MKKIAFFLIIVSAFTSVNLFSSEIQTSAVSFQFISPAGESGMVPMSMTGTKDYAGLSRGMLGMGIAGAIMTGAGLILEISGIAIWVYYGAAAFGGIATLNATTAVDSLMYLYIAYAMIGIGSTVLFFGLAMMIVGFVLYGVFKKKAEKVSFNLITNPEEETVGLSVSYKF
jgi:hypothetical protein